MRGEIGCVSTPTSGYSLREAARRESMRACGVATSQSTGESPGNRYRRTGRPVRGGGPRGSDLQIQNIRDPKIAARLPPYFTAAFPQTASFIVLPIVSGDSPIACILVGRDVPETGPISSEDIGLLRAVRGQIILAMKTVR